MSGISIAIMGLVCIAAVAALVVVAWKFRPTGTATSYSTGGYKRRKEEKPKIKEGPGVDEEQEIQDLFKRLREYADFLFSFTPGDTVEVQAVPAEEICHKCNVSAEKGAPLAGLVEGEEGTFTIYVQKGLPQDLCYAAMAKELAHAWQEMEGFGGLDIEKKEGFAEWVAFKLTELAGFDADAVFEDFSGDLETSGRKKFEVLEEQFGVEGAVKAGKSKGRNLKVLRSPEEEREEEPEEEPAQEPEKPTREEE